MDNKIVLLVGITAGIAAAVYLLYQELRKQRTEIRDQNMQIRALLQQAKRVEGLIYTYNIDQLEGTHGSRRQRSRVMSSHIFPMEESMRDMIYVWNEDDKEKQGDDDKDEAILNHEHGLESHRDPEKEESESETSNSHSSSDTESSSSEEEEERQTQQHMSIPTFRPPNPINLIPQSHLFRSPQIVNVPQQRFQRVPRMLSSHTSQPIAHSQRHVPQHVSQHIPHQQQSIRSFIPQPQQLLNQLQLQPRNRFVPPQPQSQSQSQHQFRQTTFGSQNESSQRSINQAYITPDGSSIGIISVTTSEVSAPVSSKEPIIENIKSFDVSSEESSELIEQEQTSDIANKESDKDDSEEAKEAEEVEEEAGEDNTLSAINAVIGGAVETLESVMDFDDEKQSYDKDQMISTKKRYYKDTPRNRQLERVGKSY